MNLSRLNVLAIASVTLLAACSDPAGITGKRFELERARHLWEDRAVADYDMTVRLTGAWLSGAAQIQVRGGVPVSVQAVSQGNQLPPEAFRDYDTVEELFGILQHAVDEGADRIDAEFDARYGVPLDVYVDYRETWADDEHGFTVEAFERR
jgi:phage gp36-like protein